MAPSGPSCTLSMAPFSTGLQIPDQGLAFSGLLASQQTFSQDGGGGSLMPGSSGALRMGPAFRAPHSMSMLMSSGGACAQPGLLLPQGTEGSAAKRAQLCFAVIGFAWFQGHNMQLSYLCCGS